MRANLRKGKIDRVSGPKRAGILIRVSTAEQGKTDKASPEVQERDCREHCQQAGYTVVAVYRDIQKYKDSRGRLVEPSGTRSDRPGLNQALADIDAGKIDVLVAWRLDRITRGITRAVIDLKERMKQGKVTIELAKEQFNLSTFEILAWAAGVELEAKHDRLMGGVEKRLANGKLWNMFRPYGYNKEDGHFKENPEEAKFIKLLFQWFADDKSLRDIRMKLIAMGVKPHKECKHPWRPNFLYRLLHRKCYYTGQFEYDWPRGTDQKIAVPVPPIVDPAIGQLVEERFAKYEKYPSGNMKAEVLAAGLVYCQSCGYRMFTHKKTDKQPNRPRPYTYTYYVCGSVSNQTKRPGCVSLVRTSAIDEELWRRVWAVFEKPGVLQKAIDERVKEIESQSAGAEATLVRLKKQQADLDIERQRILGLARKGYITEDDVDRQVRIISIEQAEVERALRECQPLGRDVVERLREVAEMYRQEVLTGAAAIKAEPETPEEARLQFQFRRKIIERLVIEIDVGPDKKIKSIATELDLSNRPLLACSWS